MNDFNTNYGGNTPVTVYGPTSAYVHGTENTWFGFDFTTPFYYNGSDNLIMEVDWNTDTGGYAYIRADSVAGRFVYSSNGGSPHPGDYFHYQRITITTGGAAVAPTSLGRVRAMFN
ncbi:MAG: hypothetical protein PVH29_04985 [Candidatus Zixiibacteriota bacterium]